MSIVANFPQVFTSDPDPYIPPHPEDWYTFSTNEVWIGTWINGKKIYQKTLQINVADLTNTSLASYNVITHNIADIDLPLGYDAFSDLTTDNSRLMKHIKFMDSDSSHTSQYHLYVRRFTRTEIQVIKGTNSTEQNVAYLRLIYTKNEEE